MICRAGKRVYDVAQYITKILTRDVSLFPLYSWQETILSDEAP